MIIDFDSHLREGYFMDEVYRLEGAFERFRPVKLNDGRTHNTKFMHSLDPISPQGHAAHRHPYIYDPKTNWRGGDIAARQVGGYDMERRVEDASREGIDYQMLFPTRIMIPSQNEGELGAALARSYNNWAANLVRGREDRLWPVAIAPAGHPPAMADELRRCVKELGFKAGHLAVYTRDRNLNEPRHDPSDPIAALRARAPARTSSGAPRSRNGSSITSKSRGTTVSANTPRASRTTSPPE